MKETLIKLLVQALLVFLSGEQLKKFADMILDWVENSVVGTGSSSDDAIVLPIINAIRVAFNIPDNDEPEPAPE
jgi:hypothetical protein